MNESTVAGNVAACSKPTHQSFVGSNFLVELKHLLGVDYVSLHPLLVLLVGDTEAVGDLYALFVDVAHQSPNDPVTVSIPPLVAVRYGEENHRVDLHYQVNSGHVSAPCLVWRERILSTNKLEAKNTLLLEEYVHFYQNISKTKKQMVLKISLRENRVNKRHGIKISQKTTSTEYLSFLVSYDRAETRPTFIV